MTRVKPTREAVLAYLDAGNPIANARDCFKATLNTLYDLLDPPPRRSNEPNASLQEVFTYLSVEGRTPDEAATVFNCRVSTIYALLRKKKTIDRNEQIILDYNKGKGLKTKELSKKYGLVACVILDIIKPAKPEKVFATRQQIRDYLLKDHGMADAAAHFKLTPMTIYNRVGGLRELRRNARG